MIDNCFNPACRRELHRLRDGRVVRVIHGRGSGASVEHFWLCGTCYEKYDFAFPPEGGVTLDARPQPHTPEVRFGEVLLPS